MAASGSEISSTHSRAIRKWAFLFDRAYQADSSAFSSWISSYDGQPIPLAEMEQWLDGTVDRILACHPRAVLEIGCGTGLIVRRVAPLVDLYAGVDISPAAIDQLKARIGDAPGVTLLCCAAHEVAAHFEPAFDLVVINSVIQYFTDTDYLDAVLAQAIALVRPGGTLFIGDVRNADLRHAFAASVALHQAGPDADPEDLRAKAAGLAEAGGELLLPPIWFDRLGDRLPRIASVSALLKPGSYDNELSAFRYDVVIRLDTAPIEGGGDAIAWNDVADPWADIEGRLSGAADRALTITGIGNARLGPSLAAQSRIDGSTSPDRPAERPDRFEALGRRLGFDVALQGSAGDPGGFDVRFSPPAR